MCAVMGEMIFLVRGYHRVLTRANGIGAARKIGVEQRAAPQAYKNLSGSAGRIGASSVCSLCKPRRYFCSSSNAYAATDWDKQTEFHGKHEGARHSDERSLSPHS